jgi:2'-5' RNA ligase
MEAQGVFDFCRHGPARPKKPERLFLALLPDGQTALRIADFAEQFVRGNGLQGTRVKADRLHVSLHHIGDYKRLRSDVLYAVGQAGDSVSSPAFEMTFGSVGSFGAADEGAGGRRPLVLLSAADAVLPFHQMLGAALAKSGLRAGAHFTPHITLFYGGARILPQAIDPIRFVVKDFALIHSALGLKKYEVLQRWSLKAAQLPH